MIALAMALKNYLSELGIADISLTSHNAAERKLPLFLTASYDIMTVSLFNKSFVLLLSNGEPLTPSTAHKHADIVSSTLGQEVIFVLDKLKAYERGRWVEHGLRFIVPGKYFFCPMHLIDFRESVRHSIQKAGRDSDTLSASAQALLLAYLLHSPSCANLSEWAKYLHYTKMTVSRAHKELEAHALCQTTSNGKSMTLEFLPDKQQLWDRALPVLQDPVVRRKEAILLKPTRVKLLRSGISALSDLTMLADDPIPTYAMSSASYKAACESGDITESPGAGEVDAIIEHWSYAPTILAPEGNIVDRLSLYLSLQNHPDERVQGALADMMKEVFNGNRT